MSFEFKITTPKTQSPESSNVSGGNSSIVQPSKPSFSEQAISKTPSPETINKNSPSSQEDFLSNKKSIKKQESLTGIIVAFVLSLFFAVITYYGNTYVHLYTTIHGKLPDNQLIQDYEHYERQINNVFHLYNLETYENSLENISSLKENIKQIIQAEDITYIHKIKFMTKIFDTIKTTIQTKKATIQNIKADITKYGFFNQELTQLLDIKENQISLQRSMLSLEVIKFSTAMRVFGMLSTFLEQFSLYYGVSTKALSDYIALYTKRAEVDIERYLQACYLNPFEDLKKCSYIGDFDKYYTFFEPATNFNTVLFKNLMSFIDQKLSETSFPSFSITFDKFNPQAQNLSFKVTVNTLQEDEMQLIAKGIISPHIFVLMQIINLLKESKFILGDQVDINDIKIQTQNVDIGGKSFVVHTSTRSFSTPLQKEVQREIFDYIPDISLYTTDLLQEKLSVDEYSEQNKSSKEMQNMIGQNTIEIPFYGEQILSGNISTGITASTGIKVSSGTGVFLTGIQNTSNHESGLLYSGLLDNNLNTGNKQTTSMTGKTNNFSGNIFDSTKTGLQTSN